MSAPVGASTPVADRPYTTTRRDGPIATLTLARGERYNPLSLDMVVALHRELHALGADPEVRVIVLAAEGKGFSAGHDLKEMRAHAGDKAWQQGLFDECSRMMRALTTIPQPVIARVHGIATAAGCQLVSMCDLAVASDQAQFALPGVNIGVFCTTPAVGVLRNVGRKRTMDMLLTGRLIDAATALDWGLVNRVVPADKLDEAVREFTDVIVARSPAAVALGKRAFYQQADASLEAAYALASETMACNLLLDDAAEGMDAFIGKRAPTWRGR